jgi:hypothetical protein
MMDSATRILINTMGAEVLIAKPELPRKNRLQLSVERNALARRVDDDGGTPHEFPSNGRPARVACVWDEARGKTSESRVILRRALIHHGVDPDDVAHIWPVLDDRRGPRLASDINACIPIVMAGISAAHASHVVLVGSVATSMWWPGVKMKEVAGYGYVWGNHYVYPALNPLAMRYDLSMPEYLASYGKLAWGVHEGTVLNSLKTTCHDGACTRMSVVYDGRAAGWCEKHFNISKVTNQEKKWKKESQQSNQQTLI